MLEVRLRQKVERAIEGVQLQGKGILVSRDTSELLPFPSGHKHGSFHRLQVFIGLGNRRSNILDRDIRTVRGKIRSKKSALTVDHVAFRAACFTEEKELAILRIASNRSGLATSLENPQIVHHGLDLWQTQRAKRRHPRRRDSHPQDT